MIWIALIATGLVAAMNHSSGLFASGATILDRGQWLRILAISLLLKFVHESAHAMACVRYGGRLGPAGIVLLMFIPLPFIDVTQCWALPQRRQRVLIAAAGMMAELLIAALAVFVFAVSHSPIVQRDAATCFWMASIVTFLFNANPLMRFDGYFILTDVFNLPNLGSHGSQYLQYALNRILGLPASVPGTTTPAWIAGAYGVAAMAWRVTVCVGLALAAAKWLHGFGQLLAGVALVVWYGPPAGMLIQRISQSGMWRFRSFWIRIAAAASLLVAAAWTATEYRSVSVPVIFDYTDIRTIRPLASGFLTELTSAEGQHVRQGQLLARLQNKELELEQASLESQLTQVQLRRDRHTRAHRDGERAGEQAQLDGLQKRLHEVTEKLASLEIRSPIDGVIARCHLENRNNAFIKSGEPAFEVANPDSFQAIALIEQSDSGRLKRFAQRATDLKPTWNSRSNDDTRDDTRDDTKAVTGDEAVSWAVSIPGVRTTGSRLTLRHVFPNATTRVDYPALTAIGNGELPVRELPLTEHGEQPPWALATPHVELRFDCPESLRSLHPGATGRARRVIW